MSDKTLQDVFNFLDDNGPSHEEHCAKLRQSFRRCDCTFTTLTAMHRQLLDAVDEAIKPPPAADLREAAWQRAFGRLRDSVVEHFGALPGDYEQIIAEMYSVALCAARGEPTGYAVLDKDGDVRSCWRLEADADNDAREWAYSANGQPRKPFSVVPLYRATPEREPGAASPGQREIDDEVTTMNRQPLPPR